MIKKINNLNNLKRFIPDKFYLKLQYRYHFGQNLNLENPKTFNEKLQWLKLYDRRPEYTTYVDKYAVREHIRRVIGEEYLIPLIDVFNNVEEIDWEKLPEKFVLKCTHGSTSNIIVHNKSELDIEKAKKKLNSWMKQNWFWYGREWPYKNIRPRIIAEKFMEDDWSKDLKDYKFFCFNGEPKMMFIASDRSSDTRFDFFDMEFNRLPLKQHYDNNNKKIEKPKNFEEMIDLSKVLSKGIPHIRVDFYEINGKIYFGELTLYHFSGFRAFEPESYDDKLGEWLELPQKRL